LIIIPCSYLCTKYDLFFSFFSSIYSLLSLCVLISIGSVFLHVISSAINTRISSSSSLLQANRQASLDLLLEYKLLASMHKTEDTRSKTSQLDFSWSSLHILKHMLIYCSASGAMYGPIQIVNACFARDTTIASIPIFRGTVNYSRALQVYFIPSLFEVGHCLTWHGPQIRFTLISLISVSYEATSLVNHNANSWICWLRSLALTICCNVLRKLNKSMYGKLI